jgi:DNA processing protein
VGRRWESVAPCEHLTPLHPRYPSRLRLLPRAPASLTVRGGVVEAERAVAIVGSRDADARSKKFARELAATLSRAQIAVVSGGALGVDAAAHRGALRAGGRTWAVAGTGCEQCFPAEHGPLFRSIGNGPGAMLWPFSPESPARPGSFLRRNRVLVALSDAVVVVQAGSPSGALSAAACARRQQKPLWVVPAPPWADGFEGSRKLLDQGVRALTSVDALLRSLEDSPGRGPDSSALSARLDVRAAELDPDLSASETVVLAALAATPLHVDEVAERAHVSAQAAAAALLTLALEAVVVEGPLGFFRRRISRNA